MHGRRNFIQGAMALTAGGALSGTFARSTLAADDDTVRVGVLLSVSGPSAPYGIVERKVITYLANEYNAKGGINGHKLKLFYYDPAGDTTTSVRGATELIRVDNVQVILGADTGSLTLAPAPIAAHAKVPMLAPVSTQSVTDTSNSFFPWVFRTSTRSQYEVQAQMEGFVFQPNVKRVAIFYQQDAYGKDLDELCVNDIKKHGGIEIVANVSAPLDATDLTAQATQIRDSHADLVLIETSAPLMGASFVRAARLVKIKPQMLGSLSIPQRAFTAAVGAKDAEGLIADCLLNYDDPTPKQEQLEEIVKKTGQQPAGYPEMIGSTAIIVLAEALRHINGPVTGTKIRDALEQIHDFKGTYAYAPLTYSKTDHDGYGPASIHFVKFHDGKWVNIKAPGA